MSEGLSNLKKNLCSHTYLISLGEIRDKSKFVGTQKGTEIHGLLLTGLVDAIDDKLLLGKFWHNTDADPNNWYQVSMTILI